MSKMKTHRRLIMVLLVLVAGWAGTPALQAQLSAGMPQRPSHKPIDSDLLNNLNPEEMLTRRLGKARAPVREDWKQLKDLAEKLLKDSDFLKSLDQDFDKDKLRQLLDQFKGNGSVGENDKRMLNEFLDKARTDGSLGEEHQQMLDRLGKELKESLEGKLPKNDSADRSNEKPSTAASPPPTPERETKPSVDPTADKEWQEELTKWFRESGKQWVDPKWLDAKMGPAWRETLATLAKRASEARGETSRLAQKANAFGRWLPKMSKYLPKSLTSQSPGSRLPSMPRVGTIPRAPRFGSMSDFSAADVGKLVLWGMVIGLLALVLWRAGGLWGKLGTGQAAGWQLGPWPVRPGEVSTRGELVLAFEHLALLCLGPGALTCHHLELGQLIGELPALDRDRRREAAGTLARLYEQARYTPDDEIMPPETMACARRELCYLAGVAA
jgi:hypothetical protein